MDEKISGALYLVTVPVGNMGDISLRAQDVLKRTSVIACEDTRSTKKLLKLLDISTEGKQIISFHDHSGEEKINYLKGLVKSGQGLACVSDAGSPLISDPAFPLVEAVIQEGLPLKTAPGVSSPLVALELSGLPPYPFCFYGFLPKGGADWEHKVATMRSFPGTCIFFESPKRIEKTLDKLVALMPEGRFALGRELTKKFESVYRFNAREWGEIKKELPKKGEFVVVFNEKSPKQGGHGTKGTSIDSDLPQKVKALLEEKGSKNNKLAQLLASISGLSSKEVYKKLFVKA